ncbi:MAG: HAMP domain-containing sensor histidine kinase [Chloroflexota bacterium]|nr:HAMP domain-containing sensor histidine kinase [Chloroflexota bacterium]
MSLRWRIMASIVAVILLTVVVSVVVGYVTTQARLGAFVEELGDSQASRLALNLSREYTTAGGWQTVDRPLSEAGYLAESGARGERSGEHGGEGAESGDDDSLRVVVVGIDGRVVTDNAGELSAGATAPELSGRRETLFDLTTNQPVGHVYVDVNHEFLSTESHGFLSTLLWITGIGGLVTVGVGVGLAAWLSRRITGPVAALTKATQAIARGDTTNLPVTSGDELGQMSAAFNRMASSLEAQRELRRRLVNDVSHELNTPLSVIQLEARGLRDGLQTPEATSDHIIQEVERLRGLVTDLNSLAETEHGELSLSREEVSIRDLLASELARWRPQAQAKAIALRLDADPRLPDLRLDRMRMSQALSNVLGNAIDGTPDGGNIVLRAELDGDAAVAISVIDDGVGIDAADLPHVFERFYRTDDSRIRRRQGRGLGLSIARSIVNAHDGAVDITSKGLGQGVSVTIRLPIDA